MKQAAVSALLLVMLASTAVAQPGTYQGEILTLPQVAIIDLHNPSFYTDVQLEHQGDGSFQLLAAAAANLVSVESIQVNILESIPVQVNVVVSGYKSVPCVTLLEPALARQDGVFVIVLAESVLGPEQSCIAIIDPFEISVPLDVVGLAAGSYDVRVNGVNASFTLEMDN